MIKVVYFNQWFSSIANIMDDLREKHGDTIKLIASSKNKDHAYKNSVDKFIVEDWKEADNREETMNNYVDWILNLCKQYKVDIFFVKKNAKYIRKRTHDFASIGTFLVYDDYETIVNLENKSYVYDTLSKSKDSQLENLIPDYHTFNTLDEAIRYLEKHRGKSDICLKFNTDEGGASFRAINDTPVTLNSLYKFRTNTVTTDEARNLVVTAGSKLNKLMFMDILDSPEISVDCYKSKKGFIAICREKQDGRKQKVYYNKELADICEKIGDTFGLIFPFNVQFRVKHNEDKNNIENLRLLEINTRMSGGLYYEALCGINIAEICLLDCINREKEYNLDNMLNNQEHTVTHIEKAIKLS